VSQLDQYSRTPIFVFVGLSDNRGLAVFVLLVVIFRLVIIIIVWLIWVSGRHRIADEVQPSEKVFGDALDHVGLYNPSDPLTRADPRRFRGTSRPAIVTALLSRRMN
jgi:hypothetical protein